MHNLQLSCFKIQPHEKACNFRIRFIMGCMATGAGNAKICKEQHVTWGFSSTDVAQQMQMYMPGSTKTLKNSQDALRKSWFHPEKSNTNRFSTHNPVWNRLANR